MQQDIGEIVDGLRKASVVVTVYTVLGFFVAILPLFLGFVLKGPQAPVWIAFTPVGIIIMAKGLHGLWMYWLPLRLSRVHPQQPWKWRHCWLRNNYRPKLGAQELAKNLMFVPFGMALGFGGFFLMGAMLVKRDWDLVVAVIAVFLLMIALPGVILAERGVREVLKKLRWRRSSLVMNPNPAAVGGQLAGELLLPAAASSFEHVDVSFRFESSVSSDEEAHLPTELTYHQRHDITKTPLMDSLRLAVCLELPSDIIESSPVDDHRWSLLVAGRHHRNLDLDVCFGPLPVFDLGLSQHTPADPQVPGESGGEAPGPAKFVWKPIDSWLTAALILVEFSAVTLTLRYLEIL